MSFYTANNRTMYVSSRRASFYRLDGPQIIGRTKTKQWRVVKGRHRSDGFAVMWAPIHLKPARWYNHGVHQKNMNEILEKMHIDPFDMDDVDVLVLNTAGIFR